MLNKRIVSAIVALPILFAAVLLNTSVFAGALFIITFLGLYEYFTATSSDDVKPLKTIGIILGLILLLLIFKSGISGLLLSFITLVMLILLSTPVFNTDYNFKGVCATILGILYIPLLFGYLFLIRAIPDKGVYLIWFVFISSWITDTSAFFTGMAFGKTKLCPAVSPKKTVEGSIGGIVVSTIGCISYGLFLNYIGLIHASLVGLAVVGISGSIVSQIGDLSASSIKRNVGIKDYGSIMPGHGGVLDRFDSILFVAPIIYYYIIYIL